MWRSGDAPHESKCPGYSIVVDHDVPISICGSGTTIISAAPELHFSAYCTSYLTRRYNSVGVVSIERYKALMKLSARALPSKIHRREISYLS